MSTIWVVVIAWVVLDIGIVLGCAWKSAMHEREIEWWERLSKRHHATIQRLIKRQPHITILPGPEDELDEPFDWKSVGL